MLVIQKQPTTQKVPVSAKLKPENKSFIVLTQEAINDLLPESYPTTINFTETLEFIIEQFSQRNPYILQINEKSYTVEQVIEKFLDKYGIKHVTEFLSNTNKVIEKLDKLFYEILEAKIDSLNSDIKDDQNSFYDETKGELDKDELDYLRNEYPLASAKIEYTTKDEIKEDLSGAYAYLYNICDKFGRDEFYDLQPEFEMALFKELKLDNALLCYKIYDTSGNIEKNIKLISRLVTLYLYKQDNIDSYEVFSDTPCYKGELEAFLDGDFDIQIKID